MLMPNHSRSSTVTRPSRPRVARKAKASGTPAKFEATPEKVSTGPRSQRGRSPSVTAAGDGEADQAAEEGRGEADADRDPEGGEDRRREEVARRSASVNSPAGLRKAPTHDRAWSAGSGRAARRRGTAACRARPRSGPRVRRARSRPSRARRRPRAAPGASRGLTARWRRRCVPAALDHLGHRLLLLERREDRRLVGRGRRQLVEQLLRHLAGVDQVVEADRVAVALEPLELALVGVEILHPELGGVRVRREGARSPGRRRRRRRPTSAPPPRPAGCRCSVSRPESAL